MPPQPKKRPPLEEIAKRFHLPLMKAAEDLGICQTLLKKFCRQYGITRWPYRKMKSMYMGNDQVDAQAIEAYMSQSNAISPPSTPSENGDRSRHIANTTMDNLSQRQFQFELHLQQDLILPGRNVSQPPLQAFTATTPSSSQQQQQQHRQQQQQQYPTVSYHRSQQQQSQQHQPYNGGNNGENYSQQQHYGPLSTKNQHLLSIPPLQQQQQHHQQQPNYPNQSLHPPPSGPSLDYDNRSERLLPESNNPLFRSYSSPSNLQFGGNFKSHNNGENIGRREVPRLERSKTFSFAQQQPGKPLLQYQQQHQLQPQPIQNAQTNCLSPPRFYNNNDIANSSSKVPPIQVPVKTGSARGYPLSPEERQMYGNVEVTTVASPPPSPRSSDTMSPISSPVQSFEKFNISSPHSPHTNPQINLNSPPFNSSTSSYAPLHQQQSLLRSKSLSAIQHQQILNRTASPFNSLTPERHMESTEHVNNYSGNSRTYSNSGIHSMHSPYPPSLKRIGRAYSSNSVMDNNNLQHSNLNKLPSLSQIFGANFVKGTRPGTGSATDESSLTENPVSKVPSFISKTDNRFLDSATVGSYSQNADGPGWGNNASRFQPNATRQYHKGENELMQLEYRNEYMEQ